VTAFLFTARGHDKSASLHTFKCLKRKLQMNSCMGTCVGLCFISAQVSPTLPFATFTHLALCAHAALPSKSAPSPMHPAYCWWACAEKCSAWSVAQRFVSDRSACMRPTRCANPKALNACIYTYFINVRMLEREEQVISGACARIPFPFTPTTSPSMKNFRQQNIVPRTSIDIL